MRYFIGLALLCLATVFAGIFSLFLFKLLQASSGLECIYRIFYQVLFLVSLQHRNLMIREINFYAIFIFEFCKSSITYNNNLLCIYRNHYTQHRAAIEAARQGKKGNLESFNTVETQSIVPAEDICGLCAEE